MYNKIVNQRDGAKLRQGQNLTGGWGGGSFSRRGAVFSGTPLFTDATPNINFAWDGFHWEINRKIENSTPCKIVTHEDFNMKLGTHYYVADTTHHSTLGSNRPSGGFPQIGEI